MNIRASTPAEIVHRPELRILNAAAQTRIVSVARIRLDSWKSARAFKDIFCDDISEFESSQPSHAVRSPSGRIQDSSGRLRSSLRQAWFVFAGFEHFESFALSSGRKKVDPVRFASGRAWEVCTLGRAVHRWERRHPRRI